MLRTQTRTWSAPTPPLRSRRATGATAAVLMLMLTGCAGSSGTKSTSTPTTVKEVNPPGDIPDNQVFVPFRPAPATFVVKVPEGWAKRSAGTVTVFTDKLNSVRIDTRTSPTAPTVISAKRDELPKIVRAGRNVKVETIKAVSRKGGPAVLITYQVDGSPDPVTNRSRRLTVERYEFWRNGREAVLSLSGATGADNVDPWRTISNSFAWNG